MIGVLFSMFVIVLATTSPELFTDLVTMLGIAYRHSGFLLRGAYYTLNFIVWLGGGSWKTTLFLLLCIVLLVWICVVTVANLCEFVKQVFFIALIALVCIFFSSPQDWNYYLY